MKIVVLHGQSHKGSTYNITKLFIENISDDDTELVEFFMPKDTPPFCLGCFNCFEKGRTIVPMQIRSNPLFKQLMMLTC